MTAVAVNRKSAMTTMRGHRGNRCRVSSKMCHQQEERYASPCAQQHCRADQVQPFQHEIKHQRSSNIANATTVKTTIGAIFTSGPSGSSQSHGVIAVAAIV